LFQLEALEHFVRKGGTQNIHMEKPVKDGFLLMEKTQQFVEILIVLFILIDEIRLIDRHTTEMFKVNKFLLFALGRRI
jgi:hypothetical protein